MLRLGLGTGDDPLTRLLVLGCHPDDIEIGCGGTLLSLTTAIPRLDVTWVVLAASGDRRAEARSSADAFLAGAGSARIEMHGFRDGYFPAERAAVKDAFEELKAAIDPQLVLTHSRDDAHQDHRLACELTWNTFRDNLILEYEIPKWDGDLGRPNVYVPLQDDVAERKVELLLAHFASQSGRHWFCEETFRGLMRVRGVECASRYAEAFFASKAVISSAG